MLYSSELESLGLLSPSVCLSLWPVYITSTGMRIGFFLLMESWENNGIPKTKKEAEKNKYMLIL